MKTLPQIQEEAREKFVNCVVYGRNPIEKSMLYRVIDSVALFAWHASREEMLADIEGLCRKIAPDNDSEYNQGVNDTRAAIRVLFLSTPTDQGE